jgi:hypothetical protein
MLNFILSGDSNITFITPSFIFSIKNLFVESHSSAYVDRVQRYNRSLADQPNSVNQVIKIIKLNTNAGDQKGWK